MTATAAPTAARPAASAASAAHAGHARGTRPAQGASFDDAFLALLLGAADGPPEGFEAAIPEATAEPAPAEPPIEEAVIANEGVATAEAFPLPDMLAPWLALRESLVPVAPPAAAPIPGEVGEATDAASPLGPDLAPRPARRPGIPPADFARPDPDTDTGSAVDAVTGNAPALPAPRPEASPEAVRKSSFAPTLVAAAEALRAPSRTDAPPPAPPPADAPTLAAEPGTEAFREGFSERVTILARGGRTQAELTLHPADLGPIEVKIRVEDGAATFQFEAPHPETRRAIEDSLPRLAEMLAQNGISLGETQVGQSGREAREAALEAAKASAGARRENADEAPPPPRRARMIAPGRVDLFA